ncbi:hypothetical protein GGR50DRAFT_488791 [Xylaria sp. CBS 124048]|nr:hypothetical protein GGR50DRAFT_488791 [Xylaria sp. CBS 124048]
MDGVLLVPQDRGTILGKPAWKPRYVVIGALPQKEGGQSSSSLSQVLSTGRVKDVGGRSSKSLARPMDGIYLSVYKSKDDVDPVIQYAVASIIDCQVQQIMHRKQGQSLPTLTVQIAPDPTTDKLRKRRSSRAGGLMSSKEAGPTTLMFLTAEESRHGLGDWARHIQSLINRHASLPTSPISAGPSGFISQLPPLQIGDEPQQQTGALGKLRSKLQGKSSSGPHPASRDPSSTYASDPPSLRSHRSNLSSPASIIAPAALNFVQQHYSNGQYSDLPSSPGFTPGETSEQFIEGWTTAQGRSSELSSPIRGRGSISSNDLNNQPSVDSSPPAPTVPRETILDRAFQMRYIPGADRETAGEEKLTSLARFEALMREVETHKGKARCQEVTPAPLRSTWEYESEEDEKSKGIESNEEDEDSDNYALEQDTDRDAIHSAAFQALRCTENRHGSTYSEYGLSVMRPQTADKRCRPTAPQRTNSQPSIPSAQVFVRSSPPVRSETVQRSRDKRRSTYDSKNSSFNELKARLSGANSLIHGPSNVNAASNRPSGDYDKHTPRASMGAAPATRPPSNQERRKWRGSISVFGNEGGFL